MFPRGQVREANRTDERIRHQMGTVLQLLCMAHIEPDALNTENPHWITPIAGINGTLPDNAVPYTDELIEFLGNFCFPHCDDKTTTITGEYTDGDGNQVPLTEGVKSPEWVRDTMLPHARRKIQEYKDNAANERGYYDQLDVSASKPWRCMPFE